MRIENLHEGQVIKNYKELCELLEIEPKPSSNTNGRKSHHKYFDRFFKYEKQGHKYIIGEIYDVPKENIDKRKFNTGGNNCKYQDLLSPKELSNEFDGYYVYRHILNDEVIYVGKGSRRRVIGQREDYNIHEVEKDIVKRFDNELESLEFEKNLIEYYKSIGMCKFNEEFYIPGKTETKFKRKSASKSKTAFEKLIELGYVFDEYNGWYKI